MRNGLRRHRVEIHAKTETENATGELVPTWAKVADGDSWASIRPVSGKEGERAGRIRETTTHAIRIRWIDGLNAEHRVIFGSQAFEIESVLNFNEKGEYADLMCKEIR